LEQPIAGCHQLIIEKVALHPLLASSCLASPLSSTNHDSQARHIVDQQDAVVALIRGKRRWVLISKPNVMADGQHDVEAGSCSDSDDAIGDEDAPAVWSDWCEDEEMGAAGEEQPAQSLFTSMVLPAAAAAIAHDRSEHGFDLAVYAREVALHAPTAAAPCLVCSAIDVATLARYACWQQS
jgi:hypothetical protein